MNRFLFFKYYSTSKIARFAVSQLLLLLVILCFQSRGAFAASLAQPAKANSSLFEAQATALLVNGEYEQALPLLLRWVEIDTCANAYFKLGLAYFFIGQRSAKALPYFKLAKKSIAKQYNFISSGNKQAPCETYFYLATTYRILNRPDSALYYFLQYKQQAPNTNLPVDDEIAACINAKTLQQQASLLRFDNLGESINSLYDEENPVLSLNSSLLFYSSRRLSLPQSAKLKQAISGADKDIYIAKRTAGQWQQPDAFRFNSRFDDEPLCLSFDNKTLYFSRSRNGKGNIFSSSFIDGNWTKPSKLKGNINSVFDENACTISSDGLYLVFSSNRIGGMGLHDLYICSRKPNGRWTKPQNISAINSAANEMYPHFIPNTHQLFFSSNKAGATIGGYDLFTATLGADGNWSLVSNLGFPINTGDDDYYITQALDGSQYLSRTNDKGNNDLYKVENSSAQDVSHKTSSTSIAAVSDEYLQVQKLEQQIEQRPEVASCIAAEFSNYKPSTAIATAKTTSSSKLATQVVENSPALPLAPLHVEVQQSSPINSQPATRRDIRLARQQLKKAKYDAKIAQAKQTEDERKKAEAEAQRTSNEKQIADLQAQKAKADEETAKAQAQKAEADKKLKEAEQQNLQAQTAKAQADKQLAISQAELAKVEAKRLEAESKKLEVEARKAAAEAALVKAANAQTDIELAKQAVLKAEQDKKTAQALADAKRMELQAAAKAAEEKQYMMMQTQIEAEKVANELELAKIKK